MVYSVERVSVEDDVSVLLVDCEERSRVLIRDLRVFPRGFEVTSKLSKIAKRVIVTKAMIAELAKRISRSGLSINKMTIDDAIPMPLNAVKRYCILLSLYVMSGCACEEHEEFFKDIPEQEFNTCCR
jgi:hypothetical protein